MTVLWLAAAVLSAVFTGLTSVLAKCGIKKTDKDILISIVFSYFVFKENLTKKSLAGLLLMVFGTLMLYSRISRVTTFYPISHYCSTDAVALFNLRGHAVQLQRSRCSIWCGILN